MAKKKIPWEEQSKARAVVLSTDVWQRLQQEAVRKDKWPVVICETAIERYFQLDPLPVPIKIEAERERHNLRFRNSVWQNVATQALVENRTRSDLLEQILREYFDFPRTLQA